MREMGIPKFGIEQIRETYFYYVDEQCCLNHAGPRLDMHCEWQ